MTRSDDTALFDKELLDLMYDALKEIMSAGGVKRIKKGDFDATYRSPKELNDAISKQEKKIMFSESKIGCDRRCQ